MASAFWTLEDGRGFSRSCYDMAYILELIAIELKFIEGADKFYDYLKKFVYQKDKGDEFNGYGGFIRDGENIMFNFDLREFAPANRNFFWDATQKAFAKVKMQNDAKNEGTIFLLTILLDMHKRILKGENPMHLNDMRAIEPESLEKIGPGW